MGGSHLVKHFLVRVLLLHWLVNWTLVVVEIVFCLRLRLSLNLILNWRNRSWGLNNGLFLCLSLLLLSEFLLTLTLSFKLAQLLFSLAFQELLLPASFFLSKSLLLCSTLTLKFLLSECFFLLLSLQLLLPLLLLTLKLLLAKLLLSLELLLS
jgi:hypothetical protein